MPPAPSARGRSRLPFLLAVAVIALVALGAGGVAYMFGGSAPAAVSLSDAGTAASVPSSSASLPTSSLAAPSPSLTASGASPAGGAGFDGTWKVDTSIGSFSDFSSSFVGYRVAENLANVGSTTAVGRTPNVSGTLTLEGTTVTAVTVTADLTSLHSDKSMRDGTLHRQALETDQFPTATFVLSAPIQLPSQPANGASWSVTVQGKLTLHGVTRDVSIPLQAKLSGGVVTVVGSLELTFADYDIAPPQSMMVLSVADHGTLELQLHFTRG